MASSTHSPTATDAPLQYLTIESYEWPTPERPKRSRMEADERRRRHRDDQRRFMLRKQARIDMLRHTAAVAETQLHYLWAVHEASVLRAERRLLEQRINTSRTAVVVSASSANEAEAIEPPELDAMLSDVLLSL